MIDQKDVDAIQTAYEDGIKNAFYVLRSSVEEGDEAKAKARFAKALQNCQKAKKLALDCLTT
jgi:hypothetical protein